jgi:hypothetical protein
MPSDLPAANTNPSAVWRPWIAPMDRGAWSIRRLALPVLLLAALALRVGSVWSQLYVVFSDETFQYFEQGHRLAFGSGVLPWEFQDGIRSWLLPGLLAGLMRLAATLSDDPLLYIRATRILCVAVSLVVVFVAFRAGQRREGMAGALLAGGFCALWFDLVYFAPAVLTEVLAAHAGLLALWLGDEPERITPRRLLAAGACLGLACCLRYQYGPALLGAALVQFGMRRAHWAWLALGAAAVALPVGGVLDALTWGTPFQSVWLNVLRNSVQGVSSGLGTEPVSFYPAYLSIALWPAPLLVPLAVLGATRAPAFGVAAAAVLGLHMLVPHKEVRFVYLALAIAPILIGLGAARLLRILRTHDGAGGAVMVLLVLGAIVSWHNATTWPLSQRWQVRRANVQAFLAAHELPGLCGLGVKDMPVFNSGGYAYLHRDVPVYFQQLTPSLTLPGVAVPLRTAVMLRGQTVAQSAEPALSDAVARYNALIARADDAAPGFAPLRCFDDSTRDGQPPLCLFVRFGSCE